MDRNKVQKYLSHRFPLVGTSPKCRFPLRARCEDHGSPSNVSDRRRLPPLLTRCVVKRITTGRARRVQIGNEMPPTNIKVMGPENKLIRLLACPNGGATGMQRHGAQRKSCYPSWSRLTCVARGLFLSLGAIPFVIGGGVAPTLCVGCTLYMLDACTLLSSYLLY